VEPKNSILADRLLERVKLGECRIVRHATTSDLAGFQVERSKCHENVNRWCRENPGHKPVRGWLVEGEYMFMFTRHSVIDRGPAGLLDITLPDRTCSNFLIHDGSQEEFDTLRNQEMAVDV
jgi:hypothetical protein